MDMEYISKFADIVPAVGKMRKLVMEKVLPIIMKALEYAYIGVRNAAVYYENFLRQNIYYGDQEHLLIAIRKKGKYLFFVG